MAEKFSDDVIKAVMTINNALKEPGNNEKFELMLSGLIMRDELNQREADEIKDFQQLFITLKEKDKIRPGKVEPLVKGLGDIGRLDLQRLLQDACDGIVQGGYESKKPQTARDLSQCFSVVVEHIGMKWQSLGRQLNLSQPHFDGIKVKHPNDLPEQIYAMLELWKERNGTKATKASLVAALRKCEMNLTADMVEKTTATE